MKTYRWIFLVLVAGAFAGCQKDSEPELIGDWKRAETAFPTSGRSNAASFVIGNMGYVVGGNNGYPNVLRNEVFEYDHIYDVWNEKKEFPGIARQQAVGFAIPDKNDPLRGKGYVGTGWAWTGEGKEREMRTLKDFYQYDPDNNEWIEVAPLPVVWKEVKGKERRGAIAFTLQDNSSGKWYAYVGCGYVDIPETDRENSKYMREYLNDFWRFDPEKTTPNPDGGVWIGEWEHVINKGEKRLGASVFVIDNKAYICNGTNGSGIVTDFWRFDPNADQDEYKWIYNRKDEHGNLIQRPMRDANPDEDYDDDYGSLARSFGVAYMVNVNQAIGGTPDLRGHIVGGTAGTGYANWEYNHREDLWVQRTRFFNRSAPAQTRQGMISFSFPNTGRAFVGLGNTGGDYKEDLWEFIPMIEDNIYEN